MTGSTPITRRVTAWIIGASVIQVFLHVALHLVVRFQSYVPGELRTILSVTNDQGLHAWLTLSIMVIFSFACFVLAARGPTLAWLWAGLLFLGLSADDYTRFHQNLGAIVGSWFQTTVSWQVVVGPILAACGLAVFLQLRKVITTRGERLVVLAGFGCLAAALGMEALEMTLTKSDVTWLGLDAARYVQPIDEFLELLGPTILLSCALGRLEQQGLFSIPAESVSSRRR